MHADCTSADCTSIDRVKVIEHPVGLCIVMLVCASKAI